jgi:phosphatidate cytidylyltransferase
MPDPTPATPPPPVALSKRQIFLRRLSSFVVLWTLLLTALFSSNRFLADGVFLVIMIVLAAFGLAEFYGLAARRGLVCFKGWGILGGVLLMVGTFLNLTGHLGTSGSPARVNDFETTFLILFVLGLCLRQFVSRTNTTGMATIATTLLGLMYVPWLLNFIQKITFFFYPGTEGRYYLLFFIVITKFSDTGAYVVGSLIGRHKLIPRISPGKTWEGVIGAIVVSTGASLLLAQCLGHKMPGMKWFHAAILGVALATCAVVGDLIESVFKREAGAKDSGKFFPGIGGMLDLLDSLLFNAPIMYLYLRHVLTSH